MDETACSECGATQVIRGPDNRCFNRTRCKLRYKTTRNSQKKFLDKINIWLLDLGEPEAAAAVERVIWRRFNSPTLKGTDNTWANKLKLKQN